jgi:FkbM family methyltransferase
MIPIASQLTDLLARSLARARFVKFNRFMFNLSIRGLGILNYRNSRESGETHFLQQVLPYCRGKDGKSHGVILDVGANVGEYSKGILQLDPTARIYCFEPDPANAHLLELSLRSQVTVVRSALGSKSGSAELYDYEGVPASSHASLHKAVFERIRRQPYKSRFVPVTTIDDFVAQHSIDTINLLKVDVEGHELEVLKGAAATIREKKVDIIHFEFNEMNVVTRVFLSDFFDVLPDFVFYRLLPYGWLSITDRPIENVFAYQNIVAVRADAFVLELFQNSARDPGR